MQFNLKTILRVVFLIVLIYALAAMTGAVSGFGVRFGAKKRHRHCGPRRPGWQYTGMVGELIQTSGSGSSPAGTPVLF
jgi:hypothetical protein